MGSPENPNDWVFDCTMIEDLPSLENPNFSWSSRTLSVEFADSNAPSEGIKGAGCRKRVKPESGKASDSKACREKIRRDKLNDRFIELGSVLDPGRPPKTEKGAILCDAVRMVTQLRSEAERLKESNHDLQAKISDLKTEKNELRDEKQRLKTEKDVLERQVKAMNAQPSFIHPPAMAAQFPPNGHVNGSKLVPFVGYPGISMWQFMPPASVDTSQDHALRPPVA